MGLVVVEIVRGIRDWECASSLSSSVSILSTSSSSWWRLLLWECSSSARAEKLFCCAGGLRSSFCAGMCASRL